MAEEVKGKVGVGLEVVGLVKVGQEEVEQVVGLVGVVVVRGRVELVEVKVKVVLVVVRVKVMAKVAVEVEVRGAAVVVQVGKGGEGMEEAGMLGGLRKQYSAHAFEPMQVLINVCWAPVAVQAQAPSCKAR
jgi:hypothetical protein